MPLNELNTIAPNSPPSDTEDTVGYVLTQRPRNVGIVAMEVYFPSTFVDQTELETYDAVGAGKYTIGLGQLKMACCGDNEDIHSCCLTAVQRLMKNYNIDYSQIGRLEVGTETIIDKSKSVKSVIMQLFEESGNTDIEGIDCTNACYGGTAALFNTVSWVESASWDGRYGLVVAGDIAVYGTKAARPTGGAGVMVMLVGPNAPIILEPGLRASHMEHVYDFYKPDLASEYPTVDGKLSNTCYLKALDTCYQRFCNKFEKKEKRAFDMNTADYLVFHTPYVKLVQKSVGRLHFQDFLRNPDQDTFAAQQFQQYRNVKAEDTYFDDKLEKVFRENTTAIWNSKVEAGTFLARNLGNSYCGSAYCSLLSLISSTDPAELHGKRAVIFSYGSGLAASMFSVKFTKEVGLIAKTVNIFERISERVKVTPEEYSEMMLIRENAHNQKSYQVISTPDRLKAGTYYLTHVDDKFHRFYQIKA